MSAGISSIKEQVDRGQPRHKLREALGVRWMMELLPDEGNAIGFKHRFIQIVSGPDSGEVVGRPQMLAEIDQALRLLTRDFQVGGQEQGCLDGQFLSQMPNNLQ